MGKILTGIRIPGKKSLSKTPNYSNFGLVFKWHLNTGLNLNGPNKSLYFLPFTFQTPKSGAKGCF